MKELIILLIIIGLIYFVTSKKKKTVSSFRGKDKKHFQYFLSTVGNSGENGQESSIADIAGFYGLIHNGLIIESIV